MDSTSEHRHYPRFSVNLPFRLRHAPRSGEPEVETLLTKNISKAGLCFISPRSAAPGEPIEVEVILVGYGPRGKDLTVSGAGHIVRCEVSGEPGWYRVAAAFEEASSSQGTGWNQLAAVLEDLP